MNWKIFAIVISVLFLLLLIYSVFAEFFYPRRQLAFTYSPVDISEGSAFSCEGMLSSTNEEGGDNLIWGVVSRPPGRLTVDGNVIDDKTLYLKIVSEDSVLWEGESHIFDDSDDRLLSMFFISSLHEGFAFYLNRKSGLAIWSALYPLDGSENPGVVIFYLKCK